MSESGFRTVSVGKEIEVYRPKEVEVYQPPVDEDEYMGDWCDCEFCDGPAITFDDEFEDYGDDCW